MAKTKAFVTDGEGNGEEQTAYFSVPFSKVAENPDGTVTVQGKATSEALDHDEQIVDREFAKKALPTWFRDWGNVREMHGPIAAGRAKDLQWDENDDPLLTVKVVDAGSVKKVKEGVLQAFSIGVNHPRFRADPKARKGRMIDGEVMEVSLVDRPSDPDCRILVVKRADGGDWEEPTNGFVISEAADGKIVGVDNAMKPKVSVPGVAGDAQLSDDNTRDGNIHDPGSGNSVDFDSLGNPVLQPGHVRSDAGEISVVTMDDRGVLVRVGLHEYAVPYEVDSAGNIVFGKPNLVPNNERSMPDDPRNLNKGEDGEVSTKGTKSRPKVVGKGPSAQEVGSAAVSFLEEKHRKEHPPTEEDKERREAGEYYGSGCNAVATYDNCVVVEQWGRMEDDLGRFYSVPYEVGKDGEITFGEPEQVEEAFIPVSRSDKMAAAKILGRRLSVASLGKAVWSTAFIDDLPDSSFAYVAPGGKEEDGKTEPRSLRHLPFKDGDGKVDAPHVRNALARLDQTDIPESAKAEAKKKLESAAREAGIDVADKKDEKEKVAPAETAYCAMCKKTVKLTGTKSEEKGAGGTHVQAKGECGHIVRHFVPDPKEDDKAEKSETGVPTGMGDGAGAVRGDATGNAPPQNNPAEVQETDILGRFRQALSQFEAAHAQNDGAGDDEQGENRALAELKTLLNALIAQQEREAIQEGDVGAPETQLAAKTPEDRLRQTVEEAVKAALSAREGEIGKAEKAKADKKQKRAEGVAKLREHHQHLGSLIDELDSDESPAEGHRLGDDEPQKEEGEKGANKSVAANAGGPAPINRRQVVERITEEVGALQELAKVIAAAEDELFHDKEVGGKGNLGPDQKPVAPTAKPSGEKWDLTEGEGKPPEAGADVREMFKTALADVGKSVGEQVAQVLSPLARRLEAVEHQAREVTRADIYVAERPQEFGIANAAKVAQTTDKLREQYQNLSPAEQRVFEAQLVARARAAQEPRR